MPASLSAGVVKATPSTHASLLGRGNGDAEPKTISNKCIKFHFEVKESDAS